MTQVGTRGDGQDQLDRDISQLLAWHEDFQARHGRPLRVLHLGNIAGNGFLNSKFLRRVGVEADIVCHDYTHVMAMPEWEELDLQHSHVDDFAPVFDRRDIENYARPDWFIAGPLSLCVEHVEARYRNAGQSLIQAQKAKVGQWLYNHARRRFGPRYGNLLASLALRPTNFAQRILRRAFKTAGVPTPAIEPPDPVAARFDAIEAVFRERFPAREDRLTRADMTPYTSIIDEYTRLFAPYDIVQCYATEPIYALLTAKRPYVTFEHGTLRHFTEENNPLHRLTALAYRCADHTFITNGDCLAVAKRLGIESYSAVIHPVDVEQHRQSYAEDCARIRKEIDADVIIYCPIRHDYAIKGTDVAIKALPLIKAKTGKRVKMILSSWGAQVEESRRLLKDLGCESDVVWRNSMCRVQMIKHIQACDVVFDQFVLPVFGSTAPQTIAAGKPVLASYVPAETAWLIPEPAPIVSARTPEDIAEKTIMCLDPAWLAAYQERARRWIDTFHSPRNVIRDHLSAYRRILGEQRNNA